MTTTTNPLLMVKTEDLEQVLTARKTIKSIAQKYKLFPFLDKNDGDHDGGNGNGQNHRRMSRAARDRISAGMRKAWKARRKKSEASAPA